MLLLTIPFALAFAAVAQALFVVPTSPQCAELCGNTLSSTSGSEITCSDAGYASSTYGAAFKACISCEMSSPYYDTATKISDLHWAIYNLRYTMSWCLFGWDNNTVANNPCQTSTACGTLQNAFEYDSLSPNASTYSFCPLLPSNVVTKCTACLSQLSDEQYLSNFVIALQAACQQQPVNGATLSLQGTVFSTTPVNITTPSATPTSSYTPSTGGLTLGAKIGIAVAVVLLVLGLAGFCVVWCGKRRRRRILAEKAKANGYEYQVRHSRLGVVGTPQQNDVPFFDSPQSQRPFANAWGHDDISPASATVEKAYFSPFTSQYTSPISAVDGPTYPQEWPRDSKRVMTPDSQYHVPNWPRDGKRGSLVVGMHTEGIEMKDVRNQDSKNWPPNPTPLLSHPGPGRVAPGGLSDEDVKKGFAV